MRRYLILIGRRGSPRLSFEAIAPDAVTCTAQHMDLCEAGERLEVRAI